MAVFSIEGRGKAEEFSHCTKHRTISLKAINIVRTRPQTSAPHQHIIVLCTDTTVAIHTRTDTAYCIGSAVRSSSNVYPEVIDLVGFVVPLPAISYILCSYYHNRPLYAEVRGFLNRQCTYYTRRDEK